MEFEDNPRLLQTYRTVKIVATVMASGVLLYAGVVEFWLWQRPSFVGLVGHGALEILRPVLIAVGVALVVLSGVLRARLLGHGAGLDAMIGQVMLPQVRYLRMVRANVVAFAMCEATALLGLLLFFCSGKRWDFYGLAVLAMFGMILRFPSYHQWQQWYARRHSVR